MSEINSVDTTAPAAHGVRHIRSARSITAEPAAGQQLTLLAVEADTRAHELPTRAQPRREVNTRFQLSLQTRERGLRHVAEIRRQLEAAKAEREAGEAPTGPVRRPAA